MKIIKTSVFCLRIAMSIVTSIFYATIQIIWGLAGIFLLGGLIIEYVPDATTIQSLMVLASWIINNWIIIFYCFFGLKMIENIIYFTKDYKEDKNGRTGRDNR